MTDWRRMCCFCPSPHQLGAVCGECLSNDVRKVGDWFICSACGHAFILDDDAPVTHGACEVAEERERAKYGLRITEAPEPPPADNEPSLLVVAAVVGAAAAFWMLALWALTKAVSK